MRISPQTLTECPVCQETLVGTETQLPYLVNQHLSGHGTQLADEAEVFLQNW